MKKQNILLFIILGLFFSGCYKYPDIDYDYAAYNRLIGPGGGTVTFFANYGNDSSMFSVDSSSVLLELDVPEGALDTQMVFNFYQFQDYDVASELSKGLSNVGSKFFYLVPIYESDGYHEHDEVDLTYHLSVNFNEPVTITYHYREDPKIESIDEKKLQFEFYDWLNANYKVYKIKIPDIDEWGDRNIFVQWNQQGYPIGYYDNDLQDIILGYWYPFTPLNYGDESLVNWTEVEDFTIDVAEKTVTFDIESTDYLYAIARVIQMPINSIPFKIENYIENNFTSEISRAAIIEMELQVVLENGTLVYFDRSGNFLYAEKFNVSPNQIPAFINTYVQNNYPNISMIGNAIEFYEEYSRIRVNLSNSRTLLFNSDYEGVEYIGAIMYDYNFNSLPQEIIDHINTNYPNANIKTVSNFNSQNNYQTSIYLTYEAENIKVNFDGANNFESAIYYGIKIQNVPTAISEFLNENFTGIDIVKMNKEENLDSTFYAINLINDASIEIKEDGELLTVGTFILSNDLPESVKLTLENEFVSQNIVMCYYVFHYGTQRYVVEFSEGLYVELTPEGGIDFAISDNIEDLPQNIKNYIIDNHGLIQFDFFVFDFLEEMNPQEFYYIIQLKDLSELIFDKNGNLVSEKNNSRVERKQKVWEKQ